MGKTLRKFTAGLATKISGHLQAPSPTLNCRAQPAKGGSHPMRFRAVSSERKPPDPRTPSFRRCPVICQEGTRAIATMRPRSSIVKCAPYSPCGTMRLSTVSPNSLASDVPRIVGTWDGGSRSPCEADRPSGMPPGRAPSSPPASPERSGFSAAINEIAACAGRLRPSEQLLPQAQLSRDCRVLRRSNAEGHSSRRNSSPPRRSAERRRQAMFELARNGFLRQFADARPGNLVSSGRSPPAI
jgi:hypothetical protein